MMPLAYEIVYALGTGIAFYLWEKTRDKDYVRLFSLGLLSVFFQLVVSVSSASWRPYIYIADPIVATIVIGLVLAVLLKKHQSKN
jgi:uncharacterized membrane protein